MFTEHIVEIHLAVDPDRRIEFLGALQLALAAAARGMWCDTPSTIAMFERPSEPQWDMGPLW